MVKVLIIEDDYIWQSKIEMMLSLDTQFKVIGCAENVTVAFKIIKYSEPDIIISDLFLGQDNVLNSMDSVFAEYPTLFISSSEDEACFKSVITYPNSSFLIKPFHDYSLLSSLLNLVKHCKHLGEKSKFLTFRSSKGGIAKVLFANIVKIEVEGNYSIFFSTDGKKYARKVSLNSILKILDQRFLRVSKTIVLNGAYISKADLQSKNVYIDHEVFPVGRPYLKNLRDYLNWQ